MNENNYTVYMHKNKINGKVYIGITKQKINSRWRKGKGYKDCKFRNAIDKYGWDNFEHIILFENLTKKEACNKEIELIKKYNSTNRKYGYNISTGGDSGSVGTHRKMTDEHKEKDRIVHLGEKNGMYGVKGEKHPCYGRKMSEKQKQLLIESRKGLVPWNKGKKLSEEHKRKVSISTKKAMQRPEVQEKLHKPKKRKNEKQNN
jgi:group I intron endonuclease